MASVRRSLVFSLVSRYISIAFQLVLFFVLARLLTPEDIGLYSVALAVIGLVHVLRDFGVPSYLIQERELTEPRIRTAFTLTLVLAACLFVVIWLAAEPAAAFYKDARLELVLLVMSSTFLLIPFSSTALALLRRDMRFDLLFRIEMLGAVVSFVVALSMALTGFGYWSLVWSTIVSTLSTSIAAGWYAKGGFFHRPTLVEWRRVARFGGQASLAQIVTEIGMKMNDLVAGRVLGFAAVGILSRAQGLMNLFHRDLVGAVRNVTYPAFANAHRAGADMEDLHVRSTASVAVFGWPFYGFFALFPLESLRVMFGPQWDAAAPLVPIFCLAGALAVSWVFTLQLLTAIGRVNLMMQAELITQVFRIVVFLACGYVYGTIESFAYGLVVVYAVQFIVAYAYKQRAIPCDTARMSRALGHSALVSVLALLPAGSLRILLDRGVIEMGMISTLFLAAVLTVLGWCCAVIVLRHPLWDEAYFSPLRQRVKWLR